MAKYGGNSNVNGPADNPFGAAPGPAGKAAAGGGASGTPMDLSPTCPVGDAYADNPGPTAGK